MFDTDSDVFAPEGETLEQTRGFSVDEVVRQIHELDYTELDAIERALNKARKNKEKEARQKAHAEARKVAEKYGLSLEEIAEKAGMQPAKKRKKVPPKFRHPENPDLTWTGRGRKPVWVREWEGQGGDLEQLRIEE